MMAARWVALSVFRESVRDKIFYNLVAFALLLIGASILIGQLTAGQDVKIIKDLGLSATSIFGLFIAIFVGTSLVSKEVDRRSVYALFAKPIRRWEFIAGKYAGLLLTLLVNTVVMTVALYARAVLSRARRAGADPAGVGRARARSRVAEGDRAHLRRHRGRHGGGGVLFELLEPDAVGGVHARRVCGRPVQRRPEALRSDRERSGRHRAGEGLLFRAAGLLEVRRQARRRPRPPGLGRVRRSRQRPMRSPTSWRCCSAPRSSSLGGISSEPPRGRGGRGDLPRRSRGAARGAGSLGAGPDGRRAGAALRPVAGRRQARGTRLPRTGGRPLLDPRDPALRRRAALAAESRPDVRAAVSAAGSGNDARSVLQHCLPLRRHLPRRAVPRRARPARPGGGAAAEGAGGAAPELALHAGPRVRATTGTCATTPPPPPVFSRPPRCPARRPGCARWLR